METENWQERNDGSVRIEATVYVSRAGHKAILIGEGGSGSRRSAPGPGEQLAALLERKVHLFLNVKQRAGWDEEAGAAARDRVGGSGVAVRSSMA